MSRVAYLGLGVIGHGMVLNLLAAGHEVAVWNRSSGKDQDLVAAGARRATSPAEAVDGADFVMYCLSDDRAVREVVLEQGGIAALVPADAIVMDHSTISPETALEEHQAFSERGVRFLDAPVFGSRGESAAGGLWIVVGGDAATLAAAEEVLLPVSETIHHMGEAGNGARMKLVGNLLVAAQLESLGEAFVLAKKAGLDLQKVHEVIGVTDFKTPIYDAVGAAIIRGDFSMHFALSLMLKDGRLIEDFARHQGVSIPATEAAVGTVQRAVDAGHGAENASALVKVLAEDAGVEVSQRPAAV